MRFARALQRTLRNYKPTGAVQDEEVTIDIYEDRRIEIAQIALKK